MCAGDNSSTNASEESLKDTKISFWEELTSPHSADIPAEDILQPEDNVADHMEDELDDSEVQLNDLVNSIVANIVPTGYQISSAGGLEAKADAENMDETVETVDIKSRDKELGHGKHIKQSSCLYRDFWQH